MFSKYGDIMTTDEISEALRLNERTVLKLVKEKKIPAMKIANQFRYSKEKIIEWIESEMEDKQINVKSEIIDHIKSPQYDDKILINHFIKPNHILLDLKGSNTLEVIEELINHADDIGLIKNKRKILDSVILRETSFSTGVGSNFALPHPRICTDEMSEPGFILIGVLRKGIKFNPDNNQLYNLFFLFAIPDLKLHLHLMSYMIRILKDEGKNATILQSKTEIELLNQLQ